MMVRDAPGAPDNQHRHLSGGTASWGDLCMIRSPQYSQTGWLEACLHTQAPVILAAAHHMHPNAPLHARLVS